MSWKKKLWTSRMITSSLEKYLRRFYSWEELPDISHLIKSSVVHGAGKHFPSLPSQTLMPACIPSCRIFHIWGHLWKTNSKSPKPSNSSQSIAPSMFLSADFTRDCRNILHQKRLKLWSRKWPWKSVDNRSEKLSEGVGDLRRLSQLGQTINEILQAKRKVLDHRRWFWRKELVNVDHFPL